MTATADKKILIFDGQVFQTPAWHRGMGKYSLEFIVSLQELNQVKKAWADIVIILSKNSNTEDSFYESIKLRAPGVKIVELGLAHNEYDNRPVAARNREVIDTYITEYFNSKSVDAVDYIILSLMQSEVAPAFSSLATVHNYLLFYDLIPIMFHRTYLTDAINQKGYLSKLAEMLHADTYLAISKTVANDLATILGIDSKRITSIDGAPIDHGGESKKYPIKRPFILMPTGNDIRKNNKRGIEGFALFNKKHGDKFNLVVTSSFQDFEIKELKKITDKVTFTGNVSGEELEYLYEETAALLFPTEYEGLGLPILEALEKDKPVACSDISVFREISDSAFFYFDPKNPTSIAESLQRAVSADRLPKQEYERVINKFTWQRTAELFLQRSEDNTSVVADKSDKQTLSLFCPATDETGYGTEIQQLYSELSRRTNTNFYMDTYGPKDEKGLNYLTQITGVANIAAPSPVTFADTTLPVFYIENTANCAVVLLIALANPGVLILKDINLVDLWQCAKLRGFVHDSRYDAEIQLGNLFAAEGMLASLLASQKVIVVHSEKMKTAVEKIIKMLSLDSDPKVILLPAPRTIAVYPELKQDISLYDYPGKPVKQVDPIPFAEFAESILTIARKSGVTNE